MFVVYPEPARCQLFFPKFGGRVEGYPFGDGVAVFLAGGRMFAPGSLDGDPGSVNPKCDPGLVLELRARPVTSEAGRDRQGVRRSDETVTMRVRGRLGAIAALGLGEDPVDVCLHRRLGDVQLVRDLLVRPTVRDESEHLGFAFG